MEEKQINYIGLVLDEQSSRILQEYTAQNLPDDFIPRYICHHMTIMHNCKPDDNILLWAKCNAFMPFDLTAVKFGYSDKAMAVQVETNALSNTPVKHVTLAVNIIKDGKPIDANDIKNWIDISPIQLTGIVKIFYK